MLVDSLPDIILPALAFAASQKTYIPPVAVKTVVKCCGPDFLARTLGRERARNLQARCAQVTSRRRSGSASMVSNTFSPKARTSFLA